VQQRKSSETPGSAVRTFCNQHRYGKWSAQRTLPVGTVSGFPRRCTRGRVKNNWHNLLESPSPHGGEGLG